MFIVESLITEFIKYLYHQNYSPVTINVHSVFLYERLCWILFLNSKPFQSTPEQLKELLAYLESDGYKPTTIYLYYNILKKYFSIEKLTKYDTFQLAINTYFKHRKKRVSPEVLLNELSAIKAYGRYYGRKLIFYPAMLKPILKLLSGKTKYYYSMLRTFLRFLYNYDYINYNIDYPPKQHKWFRHLNILIENSQTNPVSPHQQFLYYIGYYLSWCLLQNNFNIQTIKHFYQNIYFFWQWVKRKRYRLIDDIKANIILEFLRYRKEVLMSGPFTIKNNYYILKGFFNYLQNMNIVKENPAGGIHVKITESIPKKILNRTEIIRLLNSVKISKYIKRANKYFILLRDRCILELLVTCGIRAHELKEITLNNLDLEHCTILIEGKGDRKHPVRQRYAFIESEQTLRLLSLYLIARGKRKTQTLFLSQTGKPLDKSQIWTIVKHYTRKANITKPVSPHLLRSCFASQLVKNGIDPVSLKNLMGHESIVTTAKHYIRLNKKHIKSIWKQTNPLSKLFINQNYLNSTLENDKNMVSQKLASVGNR